MRLDAYPVLVGHLDLVGAVVGLDLANLVALLIELFRYLRRREPFILRDIEPVRRERVVAGKHRCRSADRGGEQDG